MNNAHKAGQPDGGEQRRAYRVVVLWSPLVSLGVGYLTNLFAHGTFSIFYLNS
jgi:hypothetical protein